MPAFGPRPAASTTRAAHTSSGIARRAFRSKREPLRASQPRRPAAGKARSRPNRAASRVPMADMARVSSAPWPMARKCGSEKSGLKKLPA
ncbi:hypothetical protein D3C86_1632290 [compost metagenome]